MRDMTLGPSVQTVRFVCSHEGKPPDERHEGVSEVIYTKPQASGQQCMYITKYEARLAPMNECMYELAARPAARTTEDCTSIRIY
jgi:hypothetical protein